MTKNKHVPSVLSQYVLKPRPDFFSAVPRLAAMVCLLLLALCGRAAAAETGPSATGQAGPSVAAQAAPPAAGQADASATGQAETQPEFFIGMGASMSSSPYKGVNTQWQPVPVVGFENQYAYIRDYTAGLKLLNLKFFELSAFAGYDDTFFESSESNDRRVRRLRDRNPSGVLGTEARLISPYGMLHASATRDVLDNSNGWTGALGYKTLVEYGNLEVIPALGAYWADSAYNDYYYGITNEESRRSGLGAYRPGSAFSPYLNLTVDYTVFDNWGVFCRGEVIFLNDEIKDSPMVDSSRTQSLTMGVTYDF